MVGTIAIQPIIHYSVTTINISSIFSRNSEASASEFLENLEEMFPRYFMHNDIFCVDK